MSQGEGLRKQTAKSFAENMVRSMSVATEDDAGELKKLTQSALAEKSGVALSTITKYRKAERDTGVEINPDLNTICRLASALNISPAFLLMTPDDWNDLAEGALLLVLAQRDGKSGAHSDNLTRRFDSRARSMAKLGLEQARHVELHGKPGLTHESCPVKKSNIRKSIAGYSSLPQLSSKEGHSIFSVLTLCAQLGKGHGLKQSNGVSE